MLNYGFPAALAEPALVASDHSPCSKYKPSPNMMALITGALLKNRRRRLRRRAGAGDGALSAAVRRSICWRRPGTPRCSPNGVPFRTSTAAVSMPFARCFISLPRRSVCAFRLRFHVVCWLPAAGSVAAGSVAAGSVAASLPLWRLWTRRLPLFVCPGRTPWEDEAATADRVGLFLEWLAARPEQEVGGLGETATLC